MECCTSDLEPSIQWIKTDGIISELAYGEYGVDLLIPDLGEAELGYYACVHFNSGRFLISSLINATDGGEKLYIIIISNQCN